MAHALLGAAVGVVWLVLPGMTITEGAPVADLVMPLVAVGAVAVLAGYGYVRRTRRARTRTTPGGSPAAPLPPPLAELDGASLASLVVADDSVRTSREELSFALSEPSDAEPFVRAVRDAETELASAFRMRQRYDDGVPADDTSRRQVLAGIVGRCAEAGRRLDAEAAGFDGLRGLEGGIGEALAAAESRFRRLAGRTGAADAVVAGLGRRYPSSAGAAVAGHTEQAKDRLVFATVRLNEARQSADTGHQDAAARHLRAAEGAITQAALLVTAVEQLAAALSRAAAMVPAALTGGETEIAAARERLTAATGPGSAAAPAPESESPGIQAGPRETPSGPAPEAGGAAVVAGAPGAGERTDALPGGVLARPGAGVPDEVPPGELRARVLHADVVLGLVRGEVAGGTYDPLDALRRIVRAVLPLASGRAGVIPAAAFLVARSAADLAACFVSTHRGVVGGAARTRLAEAERLLARHDPADHLTAGTLARQARDLAEQDVRLHGNPVAGPAEHESGVAGAVLGGVLLPTDPEDRTGKGGWTPPSYGGPHTRARLGPSPP